MKIKYITTFFGILFSLSAFADGYTPELLEMDQPWSVTASFGNGKYQRTTDSNAIGRFAVDDDILLTGKYAVGLELGLQSGNRLKLDLPIETLTALEWLPMRSSLGPMFDLLVTAKSDPLGNSPIFAHLKGGVAYRSWQINNEYIHGLSQLAGEVQAGFGYPLTALASLSLLYQGVFGGEPNFVVNPTTKTAHVSNIPALHAVLLGFSVNL